jgi:transposase
MAAKGDKARLYDVAFRMYTAERKSLTEIEEALGVSRQTLSGWKSDTKKPGEPLDEWDRAKAQKRENIRRLKDLFERELMHIEEQPQGALTAASMDALSKLGSLVQRWEAVERAATAAEQGPGYDRPKVFLENLQWLAEWLREHDPEGLKVLADNFDALTLAYKTECLTNA